MNKMRLSELSEDAGRLLAEAEQEGGVVIEDEQGRTPSRVYAYAEPSPADRQAAWERLRQWQAKTAARMKELGVTVDDVLRVVLEDD